MPEEALPECHKVLDLGRGHKRRGPDYRFLPDVDRGCLFWHEVDIYLVRSGNFLYLLGSLRGIGW